MSVVECSWEVKPDILKLELCQLDGRVLASYWVSAGDSLYVTFPMWDIPVSNLQWVVNGEPRGPVASIGNTVTFYGS